jgi:predicted amidophosphoribosyltransferase
MAIAKELQAAGLASEIRPLVERVTRIRRSSTAYGNRPDPDEHFATMGVSPGVGLYLPERVTLVDDVVTRGSTFVGAAGVLLSSYPHVDISCFAMIRTASNAETDEALGSIDAPLVEVVTYSNGWVHRG